MFVCSLSAAQFQGGSLLAYPHPQNHRRRARHYCLAQYVRFHRAIPFAPLGLRTRIVAIGIGKFIVNGILKAATESGVMTHKQQAGINTGGALAIALVFLNGTRAFSDPSAEQINAVVKACVEVSRASDPADPSIKNQWHFDAYYNAATGSVHNNVQYNFQQRFIFAFNKCMAERGFPLKD